MKLALALSILAGIALACGVKKQYEDYQIGSQAELTLTEANHPHGYGQYECFVCHNSENIHQVNRLGAPNFDLAQPLVRQNGLKSCAGCHGRNGVP